LATGVFFVAPLFITLLSMPILGHRVGPRRMLAVFLGLIGVAIITGEDVALPEGTSAWVLALPILAAALYAGMHVLTAKLGTASRASALSIHIHIAFLSVSAAFYLVAGDGRFAEGLRDESLIFLLRAWVWPDPGDLWRFGVIGALGGFVGYALSQAYRLGPPSLLAPFEYVALPLAMFWGFVVFGEVPSVRVWLGSALIAGAGVFVFVREARDGRAAPGPGGRR
ncbi:MAG: DMT family transporter, partial [Pseudomonadota bacterium]